MATRSSSRRRAGTSRPIHEESQLETPGAPRIAPHDHQGRACGGVTQAEDRLNAATRWTAARAGLTGAKDALDNKVRPSMTAATRSLTEAIVGGVSRTMDKAELAADGFGAWVRQQVSDVVT